MTPEGRKIWDSKEGRSLLKKMLNGGEKTHSDLAVVEKLKELNRKNRKPKH